MEILSENRVAMHHVLQSDVEGLVKDRLLNLEPLQQAECVLYSKIPAEIRTRIFNLALREFEDKSKPYHPNRVYYRPGYRYHIKQDTRLLQTCRLIYQEARVIPVVTTELVYWLYGGPSHNAHNRGVASLDLCMKINAGQLEAIDTIHMFVQQAFLEECLPFALPMTCKKFKITLRYSDWWCWDSDLKSEDKLAICPWRSETTSFEEMQEEPLKQDLRQRWDEIRQSNGHPEIPRQSRVWGYELQFINGLERFEMEMETDIKKKSQLEAVADRAKYWRIPLKGDLDLRWNGQLRESTWTGIADLGVDEDYEDESERQGDIDGDVEEDADDEEIVNSESAAQANPTDFTSHVGALAIADGTGAEQVDMPLAETPMRTYYVVNMTWDVRKPALEEVEKAAVGGSAEGG